MTFDFVMDAFPAYTYFNSEKKVVCDITVVSGAQGDEGVHHSHATDPAAAAAHYSEHDPVAGAAPTPDYSVTLSAEDITDIGNGKLKYTVTLGAQATGFTVTEAKVDNVTVTPNVTGNTITFTGLSSGKVVDITITSNGHTAQTSTKHYTVA